jgi:hypothetical protein
MAPETLNRSVILDDIAALRSKESLVKAWSFRPTHLVGIKKTGNNTRDTSVICHERKSIVVVTKIKVMTLLKTPDRDDVNACCAPITSELIREIKAPV